MKKSIGIRYFPAGWPRIAVQMAATVIHVQQGFWRGKSIIEMRQ